MEKDLKVLEDLEKRIKNDIFFEYPKDVYSKAIENLIKGYKELETENQSYRDYFGTPPCYDNADYILKSKLAEILKQRLKKYQDADDGEYKQEYLTRGELELVDRYKECSELLKILCEEDIYKIELDYIPKSKVREKIEENKKLRKEIDICNDLEIAQDLAIQDSVSKIRIRKMIKEFEDLSLKIRFGTSENIPKDLKRIDFAVNMLNKLLEE